MNNRKKYIIKATAEIETTIETSMPEYAKEILQSCLEDFCTHAVISDLSIKESGEQLPEDFKLNLYKKFTGGKVQ